MCAHRREWPRGHLVVVAAEEDQDKPVGGGEAVEVKSQGREKDDGSGHYNDQGWRQGWCYQSEQALRGSAGAGLQ